METNGYDEIEKLTEQQNSLMQQQQQKQDEIVNQQTQMQVDQLTRDKEKLDKEKEKTTSGLYANYRKAVDPYGAGTEQLQEQGLAGSGYAETTRTALYNNYQRNVTDTINKSNELKADYDFKMQQAIQSGNIAKAQSALELYSQQMQMLTQNYQLRYQARQDQLAQSNWQKQFEQSAKQNELDNQWRQKQFDESLRQNELENEWRNKQFGYQQDRDKQSDNRWQQQFQYQQDRDKQADSWREKQFEYQKQRDKEADNQWLQQFNLAKKKSSISGSSRSYGGSRNYSNRQEIRDTKEAKEVQGNNKKYTPEEIAKNITFLQGPGLNKNVKDKLSGKVFSSPDEVFNYYGLVQVD